MQTKLYPYQKLTPSSPELNDIFDKLIDDKIKAKNKMPSDKAIEFVKRMHNDIRKYLKLPDKVFAFGRNKKHEVTILIWDLEPNNEHYFVKKDENEKLYILVEQEES